MNNGLIIAAPMSGSGKTTVARGLMALLRREGYRVQPMKCGPDYIDTKFHAAACGVPSINLDLFMASEKHVVELAERYSAKADICVVEGMMGLFDGYDHERGSVYEIAKLLGLPVVLVVDARSAAYSMAALLKGFLTFRDDIRFAGVIFNKVGSERHQRMLREVCDDVGVTCLGCLPKDPLAETNERYLGLDFSNGTTDGSTFDSLADFIGQHIDWQTLLQLTVEQQPEKGKDTESMAENLSVNKRAELSFRHIAIARSDESFSFIYQNTLDAMNRADIHFFNPELNETFPADTDLLYLPGGYPEKHAEVLTKATQTKACIRAYVEKGGRVIAECGGMMYLCERIITNEGEYPMCGILPYSVSARKQDRRLSLGYRRWTLNGTTFRGHEFHYSQFVGKQPPTITTVYNARGETVDCPIFRQGNVLASYTHWYWEDLFSF